MNRLLQRAAHDRMVWVCAGVTILALGLRLWQIDFDLPDVTDVDAGKFVEPAAHIAKTGDWRPIDFQYPTAYTYSLATIYRVAGIQTTYGQHLTARLISVAGGVGMVLAVGFLARRIGGTLAAGLAMVLTALSVEGVTTSHVACTDTLVSCGVTLALAVALAPQPTWRTWLAAGMLVGLAAGTKFSGAVIGPIVFVAALISHFRDRKWIRLLRDASLIAAGAMVAFLLTTPYFVVTATEFLQRLRYESAIQQFGQLGHVQFGWWDYLVSVTTTPEQPWLYTSLLGNLGPLLFAACVAAVGAALLGRAGARGVLIALYIIGYLALISGPGHLKAARFLLLILPALFALVGWFVEWGSGRFLRPRPADANARASEKTTGAIQTRSGNRAQVALVTVLVLVLVGWPAYRSYRYLSLLRQPSTNTLMREWARAKLPPGSTLFVSPFYVSDLWSLPLKPMTFADAAYGQYRLPEDVGPNAERETLYRPQLVQQIAQLGLEYVVLNSHFEDGLAPTPENLRWFPRSVADYTAFLAELQARGDLVFTAKGYAEGRYGPAIKIYRMRK